MTVTLDLPEDALAKLRAEAVRRSVEIEAVVADLAARLPLGPGARKPRFVSVGVSTSGQSARDADEMLAEGFGRE